MLRKRGGGKEGVSLPSPEGGNLRKRKGHKGSFWSDFFNVRRRGRNHLHVTKSLIPPLGTEERSSLFGEKKKGSLHTIKGRITFLGGTGGGQ